LYYFATVINKERMQMRMVSVCTHSGFVPSVEVSNFTKSELTFQTYFATVKLLIRHNFTDTGDLRQQHACACISGRASLAKNAYRTTIISVTSLVLTCIQNVEFQKLELKWSARKSNKIVFLLPSPKFSDLILAPTILLGFIPC
jgi:hypothetical protein